MGRRAGNQIWSGLFRISPDSGQTLQAQIRQALIAAILGRQVPLDEPLPSCRALASGIGVARGTAVLAYQQLVDQGFLIARQRRGHFVNPEALATLPRPSAGAVNGGFSEGSDWESRLRARPSRRRNIAKPDDWMTYRYPFVYGQFDPSLFPKAEWRECSHMALGVSEIREWARDMIDRDDPLLIEQIRARLLPRRGIFVRPEEIMVTLGAQNALYLLASLLFDRYTLVAMEDPGYPDARNIFSACTDNLIHVPVDEEGLDPSRLPARCRYVFTTPSHQCPTTVSMPLERRHALLCHAAEHDAVIIEDDYDSQCFDLDEVLPSLKSLDRTGRVIYVGSLSKTLAPGLRLGYVVADAVLIAELRAQRRMMVRHPPANNQRAAALFLSLGHHDALIRRKSDAYARRCAILREALATRLPEFRMYGGAHYCSAVWLVGPPRLDTADLARIARGRGVLIEPGDIFYQAGRPKNAMRLAITSIGEAAIRQGVGELASALAAVDATSAA